jgi:hypothetical protein
MECCAGHQFVADGDLLCDPHKGAARQRVRPPGKATMSDIVRVVTALTAAIKQCQLGTLIWVVL